MMKKLWILHYVEIANHITFSWNSMNQSGYGTMLQENHTSSGFYSDTLTNETIERVSRQTPEFPRYIQITASVFYTIIFLIGVFGNVLVVTVVCFNRNMKTSVNLYLVNLCVADLLVLTLCMPTALVDVFARDVWYFGEAMCKAVPFLENTVAHASVLTLIAISVERYRVVCQPLSGIRDNIIKSARVVPALWVLSAASSIPYIYIAVYKDSSHIDGTPIKVCRMPVRDTWHKTYLAIMFSNYFVIPFAILLILYCRICFKLRHVTNGTTEYQNPAHYRRRKRLRLQVINMVFCLVLLFFLFHLPFRVISMWMTFANRESIHGLGLEKFLNILYSGRIMFYMNHAVNPIIYNFVSTKFRNALMVLLSGKRRGGSFISSNRRCNYNSPFTRPRNTNALLYEHDIENGKRLQSDTKRSSSSNSSQPRQQRNEFYPMYAHLIQKQCNNVRNTIAEQSI